MAKTIEQKMAHPAEPQVKEMGVACGNNYPPGRMLIATPRIIEQHVRRIPEGEVMTVTELREALAREFDADYTCALTTGIFLRIVADYAEHTRGGRALPEIPYWRVVRADRTMNSKFAGGPSAQADKLRAEGHVLTPKADNFQLSDAS